MSAPRGSRGRFVASPVTLAEWLPIALWIAASVLLLVATVASKAGL